MASSSATAFPVYPQAIILGTLSAIVIILDASPLVWHIRHRNVAAACLCAWILLSNIFNFVNVIVWPSDDIETWYNGIGLCDMEAKLRVARTVATSAAIMCILRGLAAVMDTENTVLAPTRAQKRRALGIDLFWCLAVPALSMIGHYVVQPNRYYVFGITGCFPSVDGTWLALLLVQIPPLLLTLVAAYYAVLVMLRLRRYKRSFTSMLAGSNTNKSRFLRLFLLSIILVIGFIPLQIYFIVLNQPALHHAYSWARNHNSPASGTIILIPSGGVAQFDSWVSLVCGFLLFIFFGMGREAMAMYRSWLVAVGVGKIFPALQGSTHSSSSANSSMGSRAKLFFKGMATRSTATADSQLAKLPLKSDLQLDAPKFGPGAISKQTNEYNDKLIKVQNSIPKWWEVGAAQFRQMRWNGETPLPKPVVLSNGTDISLPSRETGRSIPCRTFAPKDGHPGGVFLHIHGGGWVLQSEKYQDTMLDFLAQECQLVVVSVGYRLAPEHPYPAGNEDCVDAAEWLVDNAEGEFGAKLFFMGGDSAGAHLSVVTAFRLLRTREEFAFQALVLNFGMYELAGFMPQVHSFDLPLVLDKTIIEKYMEAYLPGKSVEERRDPAISPFYADLSKLKLPPAIFTCGSLDCLLDDTVFMGSKWAMAGAETVVKIYPGAPHGFVFFPPGQFEGTEEALADIKTFLTEHSKVDVI